MKTPPKAPSHLSEEATEWWDSVCEEYHLEGHHLKLLQAAAEEWDRAQLARRAVKREGAFYLDRFDQPKPHPGLKVERQARNAFRLLLRELGLDVAPPEDTRAPAAPANANLKIG